MSATATLEQVPVLSLARLSAPEFAQAIGGSFREFGFAIVVDHGIPDDLIARGWALAKAFFALPEAAKRAYLVPGGGGQRGYTAFGTEIAKGASENDLKEFWHVGRELPEGDPLAKDMAPNIWPDEIDGFHETFSALYDAFDAAGARILSGVALHLGLPADWFEDRIENGNSILRLLHYPPVSPEAPGIRAGAHEDINLITLLAGAEEGGLELKTRSGEWLAVKPPPGGLAINVGDMLQRLTNHVLPSTSHRVVNPPVERRGIPRYAMPFFLHLRPDVMIEALPQTVTAQNPLREPPISAHDYLHERLREIGLKKG